MPLSLCLYPYIVVLGSRELAGRVACFVFWGEQDDLAEGRWDRLRLPGPVTGYETMARVGADEE